MPNMLLVVTGLSSSLLRPATLAFTIKGGAVIGAAAPYLSIYPNIPNQVRLSGDLLGRDGDQVGGAGIHPQQLQLPQESVELAGLHRDRLRLPHLFHRDGQSRRPEDVPGPPGPQDGLHHAE